VDGSQRLLARRSGSLDQDLDGSMVPSSSFSCAYRLHSPQSGSRNGRSLVLSLFGTLVKLFR